MSVWLVVKKKGGCPWEVERIYCNEEENVVKNRSSSLSYVVPRKVGSLRQDVVER
jgi:hypothetical protein